MVDALKPQNEKQVQDAVKWALAEGKRLEVVGRGSKRALGRPSQSDLTLDLSALSGVTLYEPEELVLSAKAATPLAEIEALVDGKNQQLAFEPMDLRSAARQRQRAARSAARSPPASPVRAASRPARRAITSSASSAVSGRGEIFKSGGRVVKNVTGYDLCKLLAGSFGTLAAMTDVTVKVLPKPETEETLLLAGLDDARAVQAMTAAMASSCDVSGAAHLPAHVALRFGGIGGDARPRCSGSKASRRRSGTARTRWRRCSSRMVRSSRLDENSIARAVARACATSRPFAATGRPASGRCGASRLPPARGFEIAALIEPSAQMFYDWAGGLIWIAPLPGRRRRRRHGAQGGRGARRPRHADPRAGRGARRGRRVRAAAGAGRRADQARQGKLRSQGRAQSGPHVGGGVMQTNFTLAQLADPHIASSEKILRACVHCGFCTATCPTYVLLGDELDSPRGRIYLIKEMLEHDRPATREVVKHIDRCLSCLACMTTCPSGVHYMHLVDHARVPHRGNLPPAAASTG